LVLFLVSLAAATDDVFQLLAQPCITSGTSGLITGFLLVYSRDMHQLSIRDEK
jgi:hypothetical protein